MTNPNPARFLYDIRAVPVEARGTVLLHANYHADRFHSGLFTQFGISIPERLSSAVDKRKSDFLAGRALLRQAFSALQLQPQVVPIGTDRAPAWPPGITGSITHTRTSCACILSILPGLRAGIDIENDLNATGEDAVRKVALHNDECGLIARHPDERHMLALIFSAKETLFKALYPTVQEVFDFDCAEVRALPEGHVITLHLTKSLHQTLPAGMAFDVHHQRLPGACMTWLTALS